MTTPTADYAVPDLSALAGHSRADLAENSSGRLSEPQKRILGARIKVHAIGLVFGGAILTLLIAHNGLGPISGLAVLMLGWQALSFVKKLHAIGAARVAMATGDAWVELVPDPDGPDDYYIHVGALKLETRKEVFRAMPPGGPYRVYYIPGPDLAVSAVAEPGWRPIDLPPAKPKRRWSVTFGGGG